MKPPTREATPRVRAAPPAPDHRPVLPPAVGVVLLALLMSGLAGCASVGWVAHGLGGGGRRVKVEADYTELTNRRIAVLVEVDPYTLHQHRQAPLLIGREASAEIAEHVEGATLMHPNEVLAFQRENPYWSTGRYSDVFEKLDVDRLVIIDLLDYRLHEPGNMHIWQGLLSATVMVVEADGRDPDQASYSTSVRVEYPEDTSIGGVGADAETIQGALITRFGESVGRLFYDHEVRQ